MFNKWIVECCKVDDYSAECSEMNDFDESLRWRFGEWF